MQVLSSVLFLQRKKKKGKTEQRKWRTEERNDIKEARVEQLVGACDLLQVQCDWTAYEICPGVECVENGNKSIFISWLLFPWWLHWGVSLMVVNTWWMDIELEKWTFYCMFSVISCDIGCCTAYKCRFLSVFIPLPIIPNTVDRCVVSGLTPVVDFKHVIAAMFVIHHIL